MKALLIGLLFLLCTSIGIVYLIMTTPLVIATLITILWVFIILTISHIMGNRLLEDINTLLEDLKRKTK